MQSTLVLAFLEAVLPFIVYDKFRGVSCWFLFQKDVAI